MMGSSPPTDAALLAAANRDADAFASFYRRHSRAVLAYLIYRTRDPEHALDLTAEVFAVVIVSPRRYRPERGPARAWLLGIARRKAAEAERQRGAAERARRRLGLERLSFEDHELERVEELVDLERRELPLAALVDDLPVEQRDAVMARVVDERDYRDIAAEQGVSEQTIRKRVSRGLARIADRTGSEHV